MQWRNSYLGLTLLRQRDLALTALLTIAVLAVMIVPGTFLLRVPLGVFFILTVPGYALLVAIAPRGMGLDVVGSLAVSILLSFAALAIVATALALLFSELSFITVAGGLMVTTLVGIGTAAIRRGHQGPPLQEEVEDLKNVWNQASLAGRTLFLLGLGFTIVTALAVLAFTPPGDQFSEFYLLGPDGSLSGVPDAWPG